MVQEILSGGGILLTVGVLLITGYLLGSFARLLGFPRVSGYVLAGVLLSPSLLGVVDGEFLKDAHIITHASLSVITFLIGSSLSLKKIKSMGKSVVAITLGEAEFAFLAVSLVMMFYLSLTLNLPVSELVSVALLMGALASPTDPSSTLAVIHESKAKGPLTDTVLGVTALDDATGILNFSIAFAVADTLLSGGQLNLLKTLYSSAVTILGAVALGVVAGIVMYILGELARTKKEVVTLTFGTLFITFSTARALGFDELLATMSVGVVIANLGKAWEKFEKPLENYVEDLIFTAFFVVGSAFLNLSVLLSSTALILVYVLSRFAGKWLGVQTGGVLSNASPEVRDNIAFALFPQGGIVIGLALMVNSNLDLHELGSVLVSLVIGAVVVQEFLGPVLSKMALHRAGEIK